MSKRRKEMNYIDEFLDDQNNLFGNNNGNLPLDVKYVRYPILFGYIYSICGIISIFLLGHMLLKHFSFSDMFFWIFICIFLGGIGILSILAGIRFFLKACITNKKSNSNKKVRKR